MENTTKTCKKCGHIKNLEEFHNSSKGKDGKYSYCKPCVKSVNAGQRVYAKKFLEELPGSYTETDKAIYWGIKNEATRKAFAKNLEVTDNGCVEWTAGTFTTGYGAFNITTNGVLLKVVKAHRFAWALSGRELPKGVDKLYGDSLVINHKCHNRVCVNPEHMEVVTSLENLSMQKRKPR